MSYPATVFNVMIACPGDVAREREVIREVIHKWNAAHSESSRTVLLPMDWRTHSSPEMGRPAQKIINVQVLAKCDLLVGIFATRIGTPTDDYDSGTVEEIKKHVGVGKLAMLYFLSQPTVGNHAELEEVGKVMRFRDSCEKEGLYESYDTESDLKEKFSHHLQLKVNQHPLFVNAQPESDGGMSDVSPGAPRLTDEAQLLLKKASQDSQGCILYCHVMSGPVLQTSGKGFIEKGNPREAAKWESAFDELLTSGLVVARGSKGEVFGLTDLGYRVADMIQL